MVFNVVARNQDDHVKNIAFLMDRGGNWELSPAYDMTYAFRPGSSWTSQHQMSLNGKRDDFTSRDLRDVGDRALLTRARVADIVEQVRTVVSGWRAYADDARVAEEHAVRIERGLRLDLPQA